MTNFMDIRKNLRSDVNRHYPDSADAAFRAAIEAASEAQLDSLVAMEDVTIKTGKSPNGTETRLVIRMTEWSDKTVVGRPELADRALGIEDAARASGKMTTTKGLGRCFNWREFLEEAGVGSGVAV